MRKGRYNVRALLPALSVGKAKMRRRTKSSLWIGLCLALLMSSCTDDVADVIEQKQRELAATTTARASQEGQGTGLSVKESGDVAFWLHSVQLTEEGRYVSPSEGMAFLLVDVTLTNNGTEDVVVSSRHMRLADSAGTVYAKTLYGGTKPEPDNAIPPSESTRGEIAYEVPKGIQRLTWYVTGGDRGEEISFDLDLQ